MGWNFKQLARHADNLGLSMSEIGRRGGRAAAAAKRRRRIAAMSPEQKLLDWLKRNMGPDDWVRANPEDELQRLIRIGEVKRGSADVLAGILAGLGLIGRD